MIACNLFAARSDHGYVVRVQGKGTSSHSPALAHFVKQCFDDDDDSCVAIDLLGCQYLDSTFLGCLLNLQRLGTAERFFVVADEATQQRLLAATQLTSYLTMLPKAPPSVSPFVQIELESVSERELGRHIMEAHQSLSEIPSDVADAFRRIANQLKSELDNKRDPLADTVVTTQPRK